jgi:hypothetical protein
LVLILEQTGIFENTVEVGGTELKLGSDEKTHSIHNSKGDQGRDGHERACLSGFTQVEIEDHLVANTCDRRMARVR